MSQEVRSVRQRATTAFRYTDVSTRRMEWATLAIVALGTTFVLALALSTIVAGR